MTVQRVSQYTHDAAVLDSIATVLYSSFKSTGYNTAHAVESVREALEHIQHSNLHDMFIVWQDDAVVGVGIGVETVPWYNLRTRDFSELVVGVAEHLSALTKMRVLRSVHEALEGAAKARNCSRVFMGTSSGVSTDSYIRVLLKRGYEAFGVTMKKEL